MDKLQPILKHHFWILLVPLLSMNLWGYFSANSLLKAAITTRQGQLDTAKSSIPGGTANENKKYSEELKKGNDRLEGFVHDELQDLWNRQQTRMAWPPQVAADIPKEYGGEIKDRKVRFTYQNAYPEVIRRLHESVEPYVADKRGITWTPKVDFPIQLIPQVEITNLAIQSKPMWDAQEDIWVTQFILDAIREMNKDADSASSAVIRRVIEYRLMGGDGETSGGDAAAAGGDSEGAMGGMTQSMAGGFGPGKGGAGRGNGEGPGGAGGSAIPSALKFDPQEEFGKGGEEQPGAAGGGMGGSAMTAMSMSGGEGDAEAAATEEPTGPLRYVKEDKDAKFVERGFYLSVIINQNKLVDFLVTLSNSEWPIRVVRFHFGKNPYTVDPFTASRSGAGGGGGFGTGASASGMEGMEGMRRGRGGAGASGAMSMQGGMGLAGGRQTPGSGMMGGGRGAVDTGYPVDALQQPDLVQLDLAGLITIYRQPPQGVVPAEGDAPADSDAPADGSSPETPSADATGDTAAADPAASDPAGESAVPSADAAATDAAATDAATTDAATTDAATTDAATTDAATTEPATPAAAMEPDAAEALPSDAAPAEEAGDPPAAAPAETAPPKAPTADAAAESPAEGDGSLPVEPSAESGVEPAVDAPPATDSPMPETPVKP